MSHKSIIASDLPVIREVLNDRNSILVESDDINSWLNAIIKLKDFKHREIISSKALDDFYKYSGKIGAIGDLENKLNTYFKINLKVYFSKVQNKLFY